MMLLLSLAFHLSLIQIMTSRRTSFVGKLLLLLPILLLLLRVRIEVKRLIGCSLTSFAWALSVWAVAADVVAVV